MTILAHLMNDDGSLYRVIELPRLEHVLREAVQPDWVAMVRRMQREGYGQLEQDWSEVLWQPYLWDETSALYVRVRT